MSRRPGLSKALPMKATLNHLDKPAFRDKPPQGTHACLTQNSHFRDGRVIDCE